MIRNALGGLLVVLLALGAAALADDPAKPDQPEPPVRLKKKARPEAAPTPEKQPETPPAKKGEVTPKKDEAKAEEARENAEKEAAELEQKIHELTNRVSKNLRVAEERLEKKDPGEKTQQVQRDILEDLDELIKQTQQRQQQEQQSSSSSSSSQQSKQSQQARARRMQRNRSTARRQTPSPKEQSLDPKTGNPRVGKSQQDGMSKIADLYKDVWGNLPETLRQEMDQYSREQFMAKYSDLLKQYYATIAEKGRKSKE
jgi:hypothetical protein